MRKKKRKVKLQYYDKKAKEEAMRMRHVKNIYGFGRKVSGSFGSKNR